MNNKEQQARKRFEVTGKTEGNLGESQGIA